MTSPRKRWMIVLICGTLAFLLVRRMTKHETLKATSSDRRFTLRVCVDDDVPIEIVDNRRGALVPIRMTTEFTNGVHELLHHAYDAQDPSWQADNKTCSVLITTGDTRKDRFIWMSVTGEPPKAQVTGLEAVDD